MASATRDYGAALAQASSLTEHPYAGTGRCDLQPTDIGRLEKQLAEAAAAASALAEAVSAASAALAVEVPVTLEEAYLLANGIERLANPPALNDALLVRLIELKAKGRLRETLTTGTDWREARDAAAPDFVEAAWSSDAASLRVPLTTGQSSFFARWGSAYRQASRQLAGLLSGTIPKRAAERTELVDRLLQVTALRGAWRDDEGWCAELLGDEWRGERTAFASLREALGWCERACDGTLPLDATKAVALARDPKSPP